MVAPLFLAIEEQPSQLGGRDRRHTIEKMDSEFSVVVPRRQKRGRFQIRLKQLFLLQAALAVPLALVVLMWQLMERARLAQAEREHQLQALEKVGWVKDDDGELRLMTPNETCTDDDLSLLLPFADDLVELHLRRTAITDDAGETIAKLHRLRTLDVSSTSVGAEFCRSISTLSELFWLNMAGCKINDGVKDLRRLPLSWLEVMKSDLDDTGLQELREIKTLRNLHLEGTNVSQAAIKAFQEARPDVTVW